MRKIMLIGLVLILAMVTGAYAADFPKRNITSVVVWGAGGGTDTCNRIIAAEMQKFLGVNINVINKTGGVAGSVGMMYGFSRPHDGYTLTGLSESNVTAGVQGGWDKNFNVWDVFIVGGSPDVISVTPDTPYKSLKDLIDAAKNLLLEPEKTVAEVAYQLGYEYPQYFSRLFKKKVGISPSRYQEQQVKH